MNFFYDFLDEHVLEFAQALSTGLCFVEPLAFKTDSLFNEGLSSKVRYKFLQLPKRIYLLVNEAPSPASYER